MPCMRDWECPCGASGEVFITEVSNYPEVFQHTCGRIARLVWKSFGPKGRVGGDKGRYPHYDVGLGVTVHSSDERNAIAKSRGLEIVSREEFTKNAESAADRSDEMAWDSVAWREAAVKAHNDLKYGNVEVPTLTTMEDVSADLIDTTEKKP